MALVRDHHGDPLFYGVRPVNASVSGPAIEKVSVVGTGASPTVPVTLVELRAASRPASDGRRRDLESVRRRLEERNDAPGPRRRRQRDLALPRVDALVRDLEGPSDRLSIEREGDASHALL